MIGEHSPPRRQSRLYVDIPPPPCGCRPPEAATGAARRTTCWTRPARAGMPRLDRRRVAGFASVSSTTDRVAAAVAVVGDGDTDTSDQVAGLEAAAFSSRRVRVTATAGLCNARRLGGGHDDRVRREARTRHAVGDGTGVSVIVEPSRSHRQRDDERPKCRVMACTVPLPVGPLTSVEQRKREARHHTGELRVGSDAFVSWMRVAIDRSSPTVVRFAVGVIHFDAQRGGSARACCVIGFVQFCLVGPRAVHQACRGRRTSSGCQGARRRDDRAVVVTPSTSPGTS